MEDFLDTRKVQFPRKDGTTTGQNTGVTTPKKLNLPAAMPTSSRPASPVSGNELVNGSAVLAAALQKKINRKRKAPPLQQPHTPQHQSAAAAAAATAALSTPQHQHHHTPQQPLTPQLPAPPTPQTPFPPPTISIDTEDSQEILPTTPRQSGSMVTHHDDVVTRMKNVEMIELGKHRINPWYFAPYPQVCICCQ